MDPNCGGLSGGNDIDCDNVPIGGTEPNILLIKKTEWDEAVTNGTITFTSNLITAIVLTTGDQGYLFESFPNTVKPLVSTVIKASGSRYKQSIEFVCPGSKSTVDAIVDEMKDERYVVIFINSFKDEDGAGKYKVFGVDAGLKRPEGGAEKDAYSDVDGVWLLKLESTEQALESKGQYSFYNTDESTTDAQFTTLQSAAV